MHILLFRLLNLCQFCSNWKRLSKSLPLLINFDFWQKTSVNSNEALNIFTNFCYWLKDRSTKAQLAVSGISSHFVILVSYTESLLTELFVILIKTNEIEVICWPTFSLHLVLKLPRIDSRSINASDFQKSHELFKEYPRNAINYCIPLIQDR